MKWVVSKLAILFYTIFYINESFSYENLIIRDSQNKIYFDDISYLQNQINIIMSQNKTPGLAIALVDRKGIIWAQSFGLRSYRAKDKVNLDTLFSNQSQSKVFTTIGILKAVQDGVLSLDTPIVNYLPDIRIFDPSGGQSIKEISIRNLLSHTAGFAHEAPVGNNFDSSPTFENHIKSILEGTWLEFKAGTSYNYSNIGIDLAGYILQVKSGLKFSEYINQNVFFPLNMKNSTFDVNKYLQNKNRAEGFIEQIKKNILNYSMIPSGGMYSSVKDISNFLEFILNNGMYNKICLLNEILLNEMKYIPYFQENQKEGYALGIWKGIRNHSFYFSHLGRGFGFSSNLEWYPDFDLGIVVLTNKYDLNNIDIKISHKIIDTVIENIKNMEYLNLKKKIIGDYVSSSTKIKIIDHVEHNTIKVTGHMNFGAFGYDIQEINLLLNYVGNGRFYSKDLNEYFLFNKIGPTNFSSFKRESDGYTWYLNDTLIKCDPIETINSINYKGTYFLKGYGPNSYFNFSIRNGCNYFESYILRMINSNTFMAPNGKVLEVINNKIYWSNLMLEKEN